MNPVEFAAKWKGSTRTERAAAQEHFIDLCRMMGAPTPNEADRTGEAYAFEKGASKTGGGEGFADVWKRDHFALEYKGKRKDLSAAYQQLLQYREALENPPLLVVCDLNRFIVHTNFTGTVKHEHAFTLDDLTKDASRCLRILSAVMTHPDELRPATTRREMTEEAAREFAALATTLRGRGHDPQSVAHFLNKLLFCMFSEDAGLLPKDLLKRLAEGTREDSAAFAAGLTDLFAKMSQAGGLFGTERIQWFNGGLFDGADVVPLERDEIDIVRRVSVLDWAEIEPSIFGTLFERGLDPDKRSQLGAHYTDRESIVRLVEPVLIAPLRREFEGARTRILDLVASGKKVNEKNTKKNPHALLLEFLDRIASVRVLDPACGSGNFLYVALQALKDLEREVNQWGFENLGTPARLPQVGPQQVRGIEVNLYAAELARVTIWIGEIQWMLNNGFSYRTEPILQPLDSIECRDAILDLSDAACPKEPDWPDADVIIGNPPFLGAKFLRGVLGSDYVDALFDVYGKRIPGMSDLVCYWYEKARAMVAAGKTARVGLLATQGIRGGASRRVLERVKESGDIFYGWADEPWVLDGASVHVSFVGFDDGSEISRVLDGQPAMAIHSNLTAGLDLTRAHRIAENRGIAFVGDVKSGAFDITAEVAEAMCSHANPDGRSNRDVVRPWVNGQDMTRRSRGMYIVDFGATMTVEQAALYEEPFEYVRRHVKPERDKARRKKYREAWWLHAEPCTGMRKALAGLSRYLATPVLTKFRLFVWLPAETLADHQLIVFARDDDYFFGVLHSRVHEVWALRKGTQQETRPRYTPTTTFETFPFPRPTDAQKDAIAAAAKELNAPREGWLNPPGSAEADLKKRTLTNLYNARPTWLVHAHARLDDAVLAAYGWPADIGNDQLLGRLLDLNLARDPV